MKNHTQWWNGKLLTAYWIGWMNRHPLYKFQLAFDLQLALSWVRMCFVLLCFFFCFWFANRCEFYKHFDAGIKQSVGRGAEIWHLNSNHKHKHSLWFANTTLHNTHTHTHVYLPLSVSLPHSLPHHFVCYCWPFELLKQMKIMNRILVYFVEFVLVVLVLVVVYVRVCG